MNRVETKSGSDLKSNKTDEFKFVVTLIVTFSTIEYTIYNYINNNLLDPFLSNLLYMLTPCAVSIVFGLMAYIIVKGISFETENPTTREKLEKLSSLVYIYTFSVGL